MALANSNTTTAPSAPATSNRQTQGAARRLIDVRPLIEIELGMRVEASMLITSGRLHGDPYGPIHSRLGNGCAKGPARIRDQRSPSRGPTEPRDGWQ